LVNLLHLHGVLKYRNVGGVILMMSLAMMMEKNQTIIIREGSRAILSRPDTSVPSSNTIERGTRHLSGKAAVGQAGSLLIESSKSGVHPGHITTHGKAC
jgi:hypothetical protein